MMGNGGKAPKTSATHTVAVYDATGRVVRMHSVVVFEGGKAVSQEEAQKEAIELSRRSGHDVTKLKSLIVDQVAAKAGQFRVDVGSKKLVALDTPLRRRPSK